VRITYQWLQDFAEVTAAPSELAAQLTLAGLEVESVTPVAAPFFGVVVGEVLECARHPNAEKLSLCRVTTDGSNSLQIICGAGNVLTGLKVAVAQVGAQLPNGVVIKRAKLRGLESEGMLCSARELGLDDEHEGIMELAPALELNTNVRDALRLEDSVLEVNATPNRGDCMSVFGIARDYTAARQRRYLTYQPRPVAARSDAVFPVTLESTSCPIFTSRVIRGVSAVARAPEWMRERLRRVGSNSISAVVDVTNYVMLELGHPLHAYDLAKLAGGINVRMAKRDERITLLDGSEHRLDDDFLVIADANGPVGLAGIMGGRHTAISTDTTDVLLEAAHFVPDGVAGRARRLGLFTDAGQRYERGVDPELTVAAIERATELLLQCAGGEPGPVQVTRSAAPTTDAELWVPLRRERLSRLLGAEVPDAEVQGVLHSISDRVVTTAEGWSVRRPSHRFDIHIEADLIEEVARLRGFDRITEQHALAPQIVGPVPEGRVINERLLTAVADRGYREIISYTFVDPALQRLLFPDTPALALANPLSAEMSEMRVSLWTGLLHACRDNMRRQQKRVRLFELGKKFLLDGPAQDSPLREVEALAGIVTGARLPEQWGSAHESLDFFDVKSDLIAVLSLAGDTTQIRFEPEALSCLHPGRAARIYRADTPIGWLGELHPQIIRAINFSGSGYLFELEVESAFAANRLEYKEISKFPSLRRDLAVIVDESVPLAVLRENVTVSASGLLRELRVFDVYRGPGVESTRKSIALGLILQDSSRTLTDVDADAVVTQVVARLRDVLSATIRDQ
jgi:phenylalanyl-tRNA synthetase beta chain